MNATKRSTARAGLVLCSALAVALAGCRTYVVHSPPPTVSVPAPPPPVVVVPSPAQPPVVVIQSENDFYEPLGAHGQWVVVTGYGRCWRPARVEVGWRPYSNGYWQRTDAGWYWASEEPWGWATYHYGRWDFHGEFGWIWVPQTQWAPAWVSWREGGGYVGWAPLRPSARIGVSIGVGVREPAFESRAFVFVEHRRMLEPVRPKTVIVNNTTIINQTVNITKVTVVNKTVINEGPRAEVIERESGRKIQAVPAHEIRRKEEAAVAGRQPNRPTAPERNVQPTVRTETQPAPKQAVLPRNAHGVEKPAEAVTRQPHQPATPPQVRGTDKRQPVATPARPTPARNEAGKPTRGEKNRDTEIGEKVTTTPLAIEARPDVKHETKPQGKTEAVPPATVKKQVAPPAERSAEKPVLSPREKSRESERGNALNKQRQEREKKKKKKGEEPETTPPTDSTRPPQ